MYLVLALLGLRCCEPFSIAVARGASLHFRCPGLSFHSLSRGRAGLWGTRAPQLQRAGPRAQAQ